MRKVKISAVSYLNSVPFIFGLNQSPLMQEIDLSLDIPAVCAKKLLDGVVDIGLVPVAILPELKTTEILTDYCIGATGPVKSVLLFSEVPMQSITAIGLDYQSRTSVMLTKVLAKNYWKISPKWLNTKEGYETTAKENLAVVVIGDRALNLLGQYKYVYDLAQEWMLFTNLPFVFACWVANRKLAPDFVQQFSTAIAYGFKNRREAVAQYGGSPEEIAARQEYVEKNISYELDAGKRKGMALFLSLMAEL
jgi:chorismate dehydratase